MRLSKDALRNRVFLFFVLLAVSAPLALGGTYRTPNFIVTAPTQEIAEQCGKCAEHYRKVLAIEWLGQEMPRWYKPCTLSVKVGQIGAGGATTFAFDRGEVFGWRMNVQGSLERVLDSVIPHEVSHTVFASHFRRPLPRWADEGAATLIEHESERRRQSMLLKQVWNTPQRIPLSKLLAIKEYPREMQAVLTLYAEGYSLADFLVQAGGKARFLEFLETAHRHGWDRAIQQHYNLDGVGDLETRWNDWVLAGSPQLKIPAGSQVASSEKPEPARQEAPPAEEFERPIIRGQSPEQPANEPEVKVAEAVTSSVPETVPLPQTRQDSPGWRRMREQLKEIPADFVNPANDPTRMAETADRAQTKTVVRVSDAPSGWTDGSRPQPEAVAPPNSGEPVFRFELEEPSHSPGGQTSGPGRSPHWSEFPRSRTQRDPAALDQASERPFSP